MNDTKKNYNILLEAIKTNNISAEIYLTHLQIGMGYSYLMMISLSS